MTLCLAAYKQSVGKWERCKPPGQQFTILCNNIGTAIKQTEQLQQSAIYNCHNKITFKPSRVGKNK